MNVFVKVTLNKLIKMQIELNNYNLIPHVPNKVHKCYVFVPREHKLK